MIRLLVVGQSTIELDGKRVTAESEIVFGLLLYLVTRAGESIPREEAQALFWPDLSHKRGRHCLRQALYRLRQLGVPLKTDNDSITVALGDVSADYAALVNHDVAASVYRGLAIADILPAYQPAFSVPFSAWVEELRSRIGLRIRQRLVRTIIDLRSKGRYREAEPLARACLTTDPLNEVATLTLAEATAVTTGNRAEAMAILERFIEEIEGTSDKRLSLSASLLRKRIGERFVEQRYAAPPETPFVGREDMLELMVEKMQEAVTGRSTIVFLWGEPGIGKTRLLSELSKIGHVQGIQAIRYAASPNDPERPLALFSSVLPRMLGMPGAIGISTGGYAAIQRFADPLAWERVEPPQSAEEAAIVFAKLRAGICELFEALADEQPVAIFLDDAHWADQRSLEVLAEVVDRLRSNRIAFVLTSREPCSGSGRGPLIALCARAAHRRLEGLKDSEVETLLVRIADQRSFVLTQDFVRRTVETSAGNPFFVSELATHYAWNGVRSDLPANMQSLLQKRLDSLSADALLVFQVCAALGDHATAERVGRVLQSPTRTMLQSLTEVERASLVVPLFDRVVCRHELLTREALERLTPIAGQSLFQRVAAVLEAAALEEMNATACWHAVHVWLAANKPSRALGLVMKMAGRLLGSGLANDADTLLNKARSVLPDTPVAIELLPLQWRAARAMGDVRRWFDFAVECKRLSGLATATSTHAEFAAFDASRVLELGHREPESDLERIERSDESPDVLTEVAMRIVIECDDHIAPETAQQCFKQLTARRKLQRASRETRTLFELVYHSHYGSVDTGIARARSIMRDIDRERNFDPIVTARKLRWAHRPLFLAGCFDEATHALDKSIAIARSCQSLLDELTASCYYVEVLLASNRLVEAEMLFRRVFEESEGTAAAQLLQYNGSIARAYVMFARGVASEVRLAINSIESIIRVRPVPRSVACLDSLQLLEALMLGRDASSTTVARLLRRWPSLQAIGSADFAFLALVGTFACQNANDRADQVCREYRVARRERWPLPVSIVQQFNDSLIQRGVSLPNEFNNFMSHNVDADTARGLDQTFGIHGAGQAARRL